MSELNPNHPVTRAMHDQWHKVLGMAMHKLGIQHLVITAEDIQNTPQGNCMVAQELQDGLHIYFVDQSTAQRLAREHGGLPN